jgi:DhnA family fructose-bisphosphate aldolase class Ia
MFLVLGVAEGEIFADNAQSVARAAREAHRVGLPLIVETVLWGSRIRDRQDADLLAFGCRMAAELGADAIKTEYTGDPETMSPVVEGCPVPVLTLGGPRTESEDNLLESTRGAMTAGANGVVYGRNIWQSEDPLRISRAIRGIVHGNSELV